MNCHPSTNLQRGGGLHAMSLVELIGVLAILGVLVAVLVPSAIRILDRLASEKETAVLSSLGEAFRNGILRTRQIPIADSWASNIAAEAGMDLTAIAQTPRRTQRAILFDTGGWLTTGLPYRQTNGAPPGLIDRPARARMMLVSSLGAPLPVSLNNSDPLMTASEFDQLWNAPDSSILATTIWSGWGGRSDDLKVQRVDLAPLFVNVVLSTYTGTNLGLYKVDNSDYFTAPKSNGVAAYFLKGTVLQLYASAPGRTLQHTEVLDHDTSYVYENGVWRSSILGAVATGIGDVSGIVEAFLKAPGNINAGHTNPAKIQQEIIVTNFIAFMSNYNRWEDGNFSDNALQLYLKNTLQPAMMNAVEGLFIDGGGVNNHYPTNNYEPCVPTINP